MRKCSCESVDLLGIYARAPLGLVRETEWANIEREIVSVKEIRINAPWTFWQRIVLHTTHQHITYTEWESIWVCDKESESVDERKREGDRCIIWGMELFNRRRWRLVSAQWSNKSSYASSCTISIILHHMGRLHLLRLKSSMTYVCARERAIVVVVVVVEKHKTENSWTTRQREGHIRF